MYKNIGLVVCRQQKTDGFYHCLVHKNIVESSFVSNKTSEIGYSFPLYLYPDNLYADEKRKPNLKKVIVDEIAERLELRFSEEKEDDSESFAPIDILDYIYAVLHSPLYREKYKEFLKIDFPRVPYPENTAQFWTLAAFGEKLRKLHLMENIAPVQNLANFPKAGSNTIEKPIYKNDKVWINGAQYFDNILQSVWEFYIGGYQPAQKWLKDRKNRTLTYEEIEHYQKIVFVLNETDKIIKNIASLQ